MWRVSALLGLAAGCTSGFHAVSSPDLGPASAFSPVTEIMQADTDGGALRAVWGSGPDDVHLAGDDGNLFDVAAGDNITHAMIGSGKDIGGLWGSSASDVWAVGVVRDTPSGFVLRKNGPGGQWIETEPSQFGLHGVWGSGTQHFAVGYSGAILTGDLTTGVGVDRPSCAPATTFAPNLWSVSGNSPTSVLVAGDVCANYRFDGTGWFTDVDTIDPTRTFRAIWGVPGSPTIDFYEGANYFGLWHYTGPGNPVTQLNEEKDQPQNLSRYIWSIWGFSSTQVVCVGDAGRIMTWDGTAVKQVASPTTASLYGVWGASPDDVWIVGDGGLVLRGALSF